jgi:hypothetical protein
MKDRNINSGSFNLPRSSGLKATVSYCAKFEPPTKALVKGLARELEITELYLEKLAEEVRNDLGQ